MSDGTITPGDGTPVDGTITAAPSTKPKPFSIKGQSQTGWIGQEKQRLKKLEGIVQRGVSTFIEVGNALTEIRDRKLYRLSPFGGQGATFEKYAFRKFGSPERMHTDTLRSARCRPYCLQLETEPPARTGFQTKQWREN